MWEYDANWLTNEKVIRGNKTLTQRPRPLGFHRSISQFLSPKIRLINCILILEKILYDISDICHYVSIQISYQSFHLILSLIR